MERLLGAVLIFGLCLGGGMRAGAENDGDFDRREKRERRGDDNDGRGGRRMDPEMRAQLEKLVQLPPEQIKAELEKWPRYQQLDLEAQGRLLLKLQEMKERQRQFAEKKAEELGLKLTPEQMLVFQKRLAEERRAFEQKMRERIEPLRKQLETEMNQRLATEFSPKPTPPLPPKR
jgi:CRISPR/Cas system-associated protein Csm6